MGENEREREKHVLLPNTVAMCAPPPRLSDLDDVYCILKKASSRVSEQNPAARDSARYEGALGKCVR